jgi:thymidine phosphorylase
MLTQMSQPLGVEIGNANEVRESIDLLKGKGPGDAREITLRLCMEMLVLSGIEKNHNAARERLEKALDDGSALHKFAQWIEAQGGDPRVIEDYSLLRVSDKRHEVKFGSEGYIQSINVRQLGVAANTLGAGRLKVTDVVDTTVGITCPWKVGDRVNASDAVTLWHDDRGLDVAAKMVRDAFVIGPDPVAKLPLIIEEYHG